MKQVYSSKEGIIVKDTPAPSISRNSVKIKVAYSCISAGTELTSVKDSAKKLISRAIDNPSQIKQAVDILKSYGIKQLINKIDSSVDKFSSLGYSISGEIIEVGKDVSMDFKVGDMVSAGGGGFALHAEYVTIPKNLVVKIPNGLDLKYASIGTIGSIAMQGIRRAGLTLGEYGVVYGTGLMGLLTLQLLKSSGVKVACVDINTDRLALAQSLGAEKIINSLDECPVMAIQNWTSGYGADAVLFTAATTQDEPLSQAFNMCRRKGRVVLVGVSGMNINRSDIYLKELDFLISTSYGPGRYDNKYEEKGVDYPYAYVRWTENRNISAFLELLNNGEINIDKMASSVYDVEEAKKAYEGIKNDPGKHMVTFLKYNNHNEVKEEPILISKPKSINKERICIGLIGAGSFATAVLLPIIKDNRDKFYLKTIVNRSGDKALNVARIFNPEKISTNPEDIFNDTEIDLVTICTRHGNHADLVLEGLRHNKNIYVEKPLATTLEDLAKIENFFKENNDKQSPNLMVGFNRRFSKSINEVKRHLNNRSSPAFLHYRMNAGFIPAEMWVHDDGGRIVGEGCHIIDLMQYLTESEITSFSVSSFKPQSGQFLSEDNRSISLEFKDGSIAIIDYFSCGNKDLSKEYMEVHFENKSIIMHDYQLVTGYGIRVKSCKSPIPQKGHQEEWLSLYHSLRNGISPIDLKSLFSTTKISLLAAEN